MKSCKNIKCVCAHAHDCVGLGMARHSCEPSSRAPYSEDLCRRMVCQREALGLKLGEIAKRLNVDTSTVWRVNRLLYWNRY